MFFYNTYGHVKSVSKNIIWNTKIEIQKKLRSITKTKKENRKIVIINVIINKNDLKPHIVKTRRRNRNTQAAKKLKAIKNKYTQLHTIDR